MTATGSDRPESSRSLWLGVLLLFGLLGLAWAILFAVASKHPVQTVPLEHVAKPAN